MNSEVITTKATVAAYEKQIAELKAENEELRDEMDFQMRKARAGSHSLEQVWQATMAEFDKWIAYAHELEAKLEANLA